MKTILIVTIDHTKPLPAKVEITDIASQRLYMYLYSQGIEAGVTATQCTQVPSKPEKWEIQK